MEKHVYYTCGLVSVNWYSKSSSRCTAVALGTVGTVPTVPLLLAGTANRTTISTEKNNLEMKKGYSLILRI
jgi:hypothetical protein